MKQTLWNGLIYRVSQKKGCIVIYLPPEDGEGSNNNDKSDHTLSDIPTRPQCVVTMNLTCSDELVAVGTKSGSPGSMEDC